MKKGLTELVFILDRSGSMAGLEESTIKGFNSVLTEQKREEGEANITTVMFNNEYRLFHDATPIEDVDYLTEKDYKTNGQTALCDAVGKTIKLISDRQKSLSSDRRAEKVIFIITTDGFENASREYNQQTVKAMINSQRLECGWEFIFLGANMDAEKVAQTYSIPKKMSVSYVNDSVGIKKNYDSVNKAVRQMRKMDTMADLDEDWKEEIVEYYSERVRK